MDKAVAVKYTSDLPAPFILAKGKGKLAAIIAEIAGKNGVEIINMPELADNLIELEAGSLIPEEYYEIVAELLVFVRDLQKRESDEKDKN